MIHTRLFMFVFLGLVHLFGQFSASSSTFLDTFDPIRLTKTISMSSSTSFEGTFFNPSYDPIAHEVFSSQCGSSAAKREISPRKENFGMEYETFLSSTYLKDLEELGYCVIPQLLSAAETELLYQRVWDEYIEQAWPNCKKEDRSNWKEEFPIHSNTGIFAGPAGQTQVMWDLRQDPRIVEIFAQIWNTTDLIVSMDGLSIMCPPEIREGFNEPWPLVDQGILKRLDNIAHNNNPPSEFASESSLKTKPYTIQGQFLFEDSEEGDGGFYCIPKSHLKFNEFAFHLEAIENSSLPKEQISKAKNEYLRDFFAQNGDDVDGNFSKKHVTAPRGSLILWDSRTIHWNQHATVDRPFKDPAKVRMVGYLCYVPKIRLTLEGSLLRKEAFEKGVSSGHNPAFPEIKRTQDHICPGFECYLEDSNYAQPNIHLTSLGESLL